MFIIRQIIDNITIQFLDRQRILVFSYFESVYFKKKFKYYFI